MEIKLKSLLRQNMISSKLQELDKLGLLFDKVRNFLFSL